MEKTTGTRGAKSFVRGGQTKLGKDIYPDASNVEPNSISSNPKCPQNIVCSVGLTRRRTTIADPVHALMMINTACSPPPVAGSW